MAPIPLWICSEKVRVMLAATAIDVDPSAGKKDETVGAVVSKAWVYGAGAMARLPAASVTAAVLTSTVMLPAEEAVGVTTRV